MCFEQFVERVNAILAHSHRIDVFAVVTAQAINARFAVQLVCFGFKVFSARHALEPRLSHRKQ